MSISKNKPLNSNTGTLIETFDFQYKKLFSIEEIEQSKILQWLFGACLFAFFMNFHIWSGRSIITKEAFENNKFVCWPYFQDCGKFYFLSNLPEGYSHGLLYLLLFAIMCACVYFICNKQWSKAHFCMVLLLTWKIIFNFVLTKMTRGNYDYYQVILNTILLFLPYKLWFSRVAFVVLYFMASTIKIHEGWILGTFFSSIKTGLPIFPDSILPLVTNSVIFMEMIGSWFLFNKNKFIQRSVLLYFIVFHLYSILLVNYRYPTVVLPPLLILFGTYKGGMKIPFDKKSLLGWLLIFMIFIGQFTSVFIKGDEKLTLEGNDYGLYMFEANHQCILNVKIHKKNGDIKKETRVSYLARHRCDPYDKLFWIHQMCKRNPDIKEINWTFDHSINGGPFLRIIDEENACNLEYKLFRHNKWIKLTNKAKIVGYPYKNEYY